MKIKKFVAPNMKEGLLRIKKEMGPDAVILQSRRVRRGGIMGFFSAPQLEITAAADARRASSRADVGTVTRVLQKEQQLKGMAEELQELRSMVSDLSGTPETPPGTGSGPRLKKSTRYWRSYLEHQDLDPSLLDELLTEAERENGGPGRPGHGRMAEVLRAGLSARLQCVDRCSCRTQVFVGPTGVGKTTTLAKLAARLALRDGEKVGLVTIDQYRLGAVEQLRSYAEIMDLPLEVVLAPQDLFRAMIRLEGCQRVLVDTAGRSTGRSEQIADVVPYIDMLLPADIHLVVSATTRRQDIALITEQFKALKYNRLVITKLDETNVYGSLVNSAYYTGLPLAYLTDGQRVPEDFRLAGETDLTGLLWRTG